MQSISKQSWLIAITILSLPVMTAVAALLPTGTKLGITPGVGSGPNLPCASGSCFSMEVAPGFIIWTDFGPGTDGGFIVGKAQQCGPQVDPIGPTCDGPSDLTTSWLFFGGYGAFCTDPDGEQNIFNDSSCFGADCLGKTEVKYLYAGWCGYKIPLGSSVGCVLPSCSPDQRAGIFVNNYQINPVTDGAWSMDYKQVVPSGGFLGVKFGMVVRGTVTTDNPSPTVTPAPQACPDQYPVSQLTQAGKEGTLTIAFTGNIVSHTNKEVKVCPGSSLDYVATSTKGPVICKIKNSTNPGSGTLRIRDHLKCTDKPGGKDKLNFKVKSGVTK